jgi:hypothetical protein
VFPRRLAPESTERTDRRSRAAGWQALGLVVLAFVVGIGRAGLR